jgi:hypothetical protein
MRYYIVFLISTGYHTTRDNYFLYTQTYIQYQMSAITGPFSGGNDVCHQRNDFANNAAATGGLKAAP